MGTPLKDFARLITGLLCLFAVTACTLSDQAECRSDNDCAASERCVPGGGVLVRDGICVDQTSIPDAGLDAGDADSGDGDSGDSDSGDSDCDADLLIDPEHCGECGNECSAPAGATAICMDGACDFDCDPELARCGEVCVDLVVDSEFCGSCETSCELGEVCQAGSCQPLECAEPETLCPTEPICIDLSSNPAHCSACGESCGDNEVCEDSQCECASGFEQCNNLCMDFQDDPENCGECDLSCASDEVCILGTCMEEPECEPDADSFSGGAGTIPDPWRICTDDDLLELMAASNFLSDSFVLMNDIDLGGGDAETIGSSQNRFEGIFNGQGRTISGLRLSQATTNYVGLFAHIGVDGVVQNLHLENVDITGAQRVGALTGRNRGNVTNVSASGDIAASGGWVGGIVGENNGLLSGVTLESGSVDGGAAIVGGVAGRSNGTILDSHALLATITGEGDVVGGLVGIALGEIKDSSTNVTVSAESGNAIGGLVGFLNGGEITNSTSSGDVTGNDRTGGLAGNIEDAEIQSSQSSGTITGNAGVGGLVGWNTDSIVTTSNSDANAFGVDAVGGLVGWSNHRVTHSFASGMATATNIIAGGLVGENQGLISESWASGNAEAANAAGGLAGVNSEGVIERSYASGDATAEDEYAGGLTGQNSNDGTISDSYASGSASATSAAGGITGWNNSIMENSYAYGAVSVTDLGEGGMTGATSDIAEYFNIYWDIDSSGQPNSGSSGDGVGLTTDQFDTSTNFTGFDFVDTWEIGAASDGNPRPLLQWQPSSGL